MASWKKVIVSGSNANLTALSVDNLTSGSVVIGGGNNNLTTAAVNGTGSILATTGATGVSISGSFSGSFTGLINSASFATTASYITSSGVFGPYGSNSILTSSFSVTSSYITASGVFGPFGSNSVITSSFSVSSSRAAVASTASFVTASGVFGPFGASSVLTASFAVTSSYITASGVFGPFGANSVLSASYAATASITTTAATASFITASGVFGPYGASSVFTSSYAIVASSSIGTLTFGEGLTAGTYNGSDNITLTVSGAAQLTNNAITKWDNTDNKFVSSSLIDNGTVVSGVSSIQLTGSGSALTGSFSGSFKGDGSGLTGLVSTLRISGSNFAGQLVTSGSIALATQGLTILGTQNEISVTASLQNITIGLPDNVTVTNNLTVGGDLIVSGTTTTLDTANLTVEDRFIVLNHGSGSVAPTQEGGIIIEGTTAGSGSALYYDGATQNRWGVALGVADTATSVTANSYVVTVSSSIAAPSGSPIYGGSTTGFGNMYINSTDETIWVYS